MKRKTPNLIRAARLLLPALLLLTACASDAPKYKIGVSQCSEDIWRDWQNFEMKMEANFHEGVELHFTAALDNSQRQIEQIDSMVAAGIDLLIVAPNQLSSVTPAIDRAYDKGIPVIVFERKTDSQKYTAFMSADNYEMGRLMGEYIVSRLGGRGRVIEIEGLKDSSPAQECHRGFIDALSKAPGIEIAASLTGDWTEEQAYAEMMAYKGNVADISLVFGHNDRSAIGARKALIERGVKPLPLFCGIDGLPGKSGGIQLVRDSLLDASYIYPTRGDQLLQLALDILNGRPYDKETQLSSAIVTHDNAEVLQLESDEVMRKAQRLERLNQQATLYLEQLSAQRTITLLVLILLALLMVLMGLFYVYHRNKVSAQRERMVSNLWNMEAPEEPKAEQEAPAEQPAGTPAPEADEQPAAKAEAEKPENEPLFIIHFKDIVEARLSDSDLTVDELAASMNLSRVQLYRKVKAFTGSSPNELLRTARLNRGYQLLISTDKTISEVAYAVGFSAPSYFTKCFKDEFGVSPSDL